MLLGAAGVRLEIDASAAGWDHMTPAQRFNAQEEWAKVYALFDELEEMVTVGAAARWPWRWRGAALDRAYHAAKALAPMGLCAVPGAGGKPREPARGPRAGGHS